MRLRQIGGHLPLLWPIVCVAFVQIGCEDESFPELLELEEDPLCSYPTFPIGVAVDSPGRLQEDIPFTSITVHHFNSVTPGNDMKMDALHPSEASYSWANAEYIVDFCQQHGKRVHGHVLVWHSQVPAWMESYQGTQSEWEGILKDHVQTVVEHFQNEVFSWDVVNEAFEENGQLRHTIWRDNVGDDYIAKCFEWAREASPDVKLFYNDFNLSYNAQKMQAVLSMVDDFRSREPPVPIDGIGFQMHIHHDIPNLEYIQAAVDSVRRRGLMIHFSELDVQLNRSQQHSELTDELKALQRQRYYDVVSVYQSLPEELKMGITVWGVSDSDSWIRYCFGRLDWPLLFDEEYEPKPAFWGFVEALQG